MENAFKRLESITLLSLGYLAQLVCEGKREPFANSKIFRMLSQTNGMVSPSDGQNQKSHVAVGKTSSSSGKEEWRTYLALFLLISY